MTLIPTPRISLVVPVYNGGPTLASCLASVAQAVVALSAAERERMEVVVCDNHSTDDSLPIVRAAQFACAARVVQPPAHLPNRTDNWHFALSSSTGEWLLMLHADDGMVEGGLKAWFDAISSPLASNVGFITARHHTFAESLDALSPPHPRLSPAPALLSGRLLARWVLPLMCPFMPFVLVRRSAYDAVGGLDNQLELTQDWDLWIRLCRGYDVLFVPDVVGAWRRHATSPKYQRVNMREQLLVLEEMEAQQSMAPPRPILWLARRSLHARTLITLRGDVDDEAEPIRERVRTLRGRPAPESARWLQASGAVVSATLYAIRAAGIVRAAVRSRGRHPQAAA